jgi:hypothetical protein
VGKLGAAEEAVGCTVALLMGVLENDFKKETTPGEGVAWASGALAELLPLLSALFSGSEDAFLAAAPADASLSDLNSTATSGGGAVETLNA